MNDANTQALELGGAIDAFLEARRSELAELLCDLVAINSQIPPFGDERQIVEFLRGRGEELGLGRGEVLAADPERPNLLVRVPGTGRGPALMLNGHVDTKPIGDARERWSADPLMPTIEDGRLFGLGASDMKAAVAAMLFAAAALGEVGRLAGGLVLAFVADEEAGGHFGSRFLASQGVRADACLIGEPSGWEHDWQGVHLASRGICCFRVVVRGTQMHSSLSDRMPSVNASRLMAELMLSIEDDLDLPFERDRHAGTPTLNVGVLVSGGVYFGVVPGEAEFACDLRTLPGMAEDEVRAAIDLWLDRRRREIPGLDAEVVFEPDLAWIPPARIPEEHPLVASVCAAAAEVLGSSPPLSVFPGATDAPWFEGSGIPTIPSFGPGILTCAHGPDEYVDLERVHEAARIYARTAAGFCGIA